MGIQFMIWDITDWWYQKKETHLKYTNLYNQARNKFSILPLDVGVAGSVLHGRDDIILRLSTTTGETLCQKVMVKKLTSADNRILVGDTTILNTMESETINQLFRDMEEK